MPETQPTRELARDEEATQWWLDTRLIEHHWCGVFKGGGAKGVAYAGALEAVLAERCWFKAVAGSSAGAITATLIAAGLTPAQMRTATPRMLAEVKRNWLGLALGGETPIYSLAGVTTWLRNKLRLQVNGLGADTELTEDSEVTFAELAITGIDLYVVAMNLATSSPVVFSKYTTPDCDVAAAVAASSAIPIGFKSGRLMMLRPEGGFAVHRLVDGGAWANYPQFVFKDASFRAYHRLPEIAEEETIVGFVLQRGDAAEQLVPWKIRSDLDTDELADSGLFVRGRTRVVLSRLDKTRWRLLTLAFWPLVMVGVTGWWLWSYRDWWDPVLDRYGSWVAIGHLLVFATFALSALLLLVLALAAYALGKEIIRVGIGALQAALSVSTDVPRWLGTASGDHVVRVPVPRFLTTQTFRVPQSKLDELIERAREATTTQLRQILAGQPTLEPLPLLDLPEVPEPEEIRPQWYWVTSRTAFGFAIVLLGFGVAAAAIFGLEPLLDGTNVNGLGAFGAFGLLFLAISSITVFVAGGAARREARERAQRKAVAAAAGAGHAHPTIPDGLVTASKCRRRIILCSLLALVAAAGTVWLVNLELDINSGPTAKATILTREDTSSGTFIYTARIETGARAGQTHQFDSGNNAEPGDRVTLRWVPLPQRLEFASTRATGAIFAACVGGAVTFLFIFGAVWAISDGRTLAPLADSQSGQAS